MIFLKILTPKVIFLACIFAASTGFTCAQDLKESGWDNLIETSHENLVDPGPTSLSSGATPQASGANVVYKYKENEKFDFSELVIGGDKGSPGDLSSVYRFQKKFNNKLPYKRSFLKEMISSVDRVL